MDYSPIVCFAGFNSKRRKIQQERREKEQFQQSMSQQRFMCRDKCPSEMLRKNVTTVFLLSQHKGLSIEEELCRDKRQHVTTKDSMSQQNMRRM